MLGSRRAFAAAFLLCIATIAPPALANVVHVPGDYPTIQEGLDAISYSGDSLMIAPGTYYEGALNAVGLFGSAILGATGDPADVAGVAATIAADRHGGFFGGSASRNLGDAF